jgi:hypothetical protein
MPEIALLEPRVLRGLISNLDVPEQLVMLNMLPRTPWPFPTVTWDVQRGSRMVAKPNIPNSEAHIVPRLGVEQKSASFVYLREKKVFEPTTLHWLRTPGQLAASNAERAVMREVRDLDMRFNNFAEWCIWRMFTGTVTFIYEDVRTTVDYGIPATHKPNFATGWDTATAEQIVADIDSLKLLMLRDSRVPLTDMWHTKSIMNHIFRAFKDSDLLSDRMKESYFQNGVLEGFQGLNWHIVEHVYSDDAGNLVQYVADDSLIGTNLSGNAAELMEGPTADDEAPDGYTGKFSKTWKEKDPSARQILLEWNMLPVLTKPEQVIYVADVTA